MTSPTRVVAASVAVSCLAVLPGCSMDAVLWGPDGARVIDATEQLIGAASSREQDPLACEDFAAEFGDPRMWAGLSAGEPEPFDAATSVDRPSLDAAWRINLEGTADGHSAGDVVPTDVFYRESGDGLCVADVVWWTVEG